MNGFVHELENEHVFMRTFHTDTETDTEGDDDHDLSNNLYNYIVGAMLLTDEPAGF